MEISINGSSVVYSSIIYWSIGLNEGYDRFLLFLVVVVLAALCSMSIGLALSAISPTPIVANALGPPILIIFVLFGEPRAIVTDASIC